MAELSGCKDPCLKSSGRLGMNNAQLAMARRTVQYLQDPDGFKDRLRTEILKNEKDKYCIRLNGTSDIDWSDLIGSLPNIQFYDYSKVLKRLLKTTYRIIISLILHRLITCSLLSLPKGQLA